MYRELQRELEKDIETKNVIPNRYYPNLEYSEFGYYTECGDNNELLKVIKKDIEDKKEREKKRISKGKYKETYNDFVVTEGYKNFLSIEYITMKSNVYNKRLYYIHVTDYEKNTTIKYYTYNISGSVFIGKTLNMCETFREYFNDFINYPKNSYKKHPLYIQRNERGSYETLGYSNNVIWGSHIMNTCTKKTMEKLFTDINLKCVFYDEPINNYHRLILYKRA